MIGAIASKKCKIKLVHIEAGVRNYDMEMPEEINRLVTDSISDIFFVTEESGEKNLIKEGHKKKQIHLVGNLMIDSLHYGIKKLGLNDDNNIHGTSNFAKIMFVYPAKKISASRILFLPIKFIIL